jgi:hypothetical protein
MTTTTSKVAIKCSCGSSQFEMPKNPKASDTITCVRCRKIGRHGDIMRQAEKQITSAVEKQLKDAFRKAGFK